MPARSTDHSKADRRRHFVEVLTTPIAAFLAIVNAVVLGALGLAVAGIIGLIAGLATVGLFTLAISYFAGSAIAGRRFLDRYAAAQGFRVVPRYRLPPVTPLLRLGPPKLLAGVGYASREFEGQVHLQRGGQLSFVHASTTVSYGSFDNPHTVKAERVTAFVAEMPASAGNALVVLDGPRAKGSQFRARDLPQIRRVIDDGTRFDVLVSEATSELFALDVAAAVERQLEPLPRSLSLQLERDHLFVWERGWLESAQDLDAGLRRLTSIASAIAGIENRTHRLDSNHPPVPVAPRDIPEPWKTAAERLTLEYWPQVLTEPTDAGGMNLGGSALAGERDGQRVTVAEAIRMVERSGGGFESRPLVVALIEIGEATQVIPAIGCELRPTASSRLKEAATNPYTLPYLLGDPAGTLASFALSEIVALTRDEGATSESVQFDRRFELRSTAGSENVLRQLFSPAFIVWHASQPLRGLEWAWSGHTLYAWAEAEPQTADLIEAVSLAAIEIATRIESEALESRP